MKTELQRNLQQYIDHAVTDQTGNKVGKLHCLWAGPDGEPRYLGIHTGWLFGKTHVVPAQRVEVSDASSTIRLPYTADRIKDAPSFDSGSEIDSKSERQILDYYHITWGQPVQTAAQTAQAGVQTQARFASQQQQAAVRGEEAASMPLHEQQVKVGKRQVEGGGVRLHKIVRTETVNQPVELTHEEIVVKRVPHGERATETSAKYGERFQEQDVFIPLRREEAVVQKETRLREEVQVSKKTETERQNISEQVRKEDVEIQRSGISATGSKTRGTQPAGQKFDQSAKEFYERNEDSRTE